MKTTVLILAGISVAALVYIIANAPPTQYATGNDDVEDAANNSSVWGSKQRIGGAGNSLGGKLKEGVGKLTGDDSLQAEGAGDQVTGKLKDAVGSVAQAAGDTLHNLNR